MATRIAHRLTQLTADVCREAVSLFTQASLPETFPGRFMDIYRAFIAACEADQLYEGGWDAGMKSARFLQTERASFYTVINQVEQIRNQLFFGYIAEHIESTDRAPYIARLGTFLTGYIRGLSAAESIFEYRQIGEIARRLTLAESTDDLEREAVTGVHRLLQVDYTWFTHRENGVWNISHATELSAPARNARINDADVDGIEQLLSGTTLIYDDMATCAPATRYMGKMLRLGSALSVPVMNDGVCVGTLGVGRRIPSHFNEHDLAIVQLVASQTAAAANARAASHEMRSALTALQDSEEKLRLLAEAIPQIVWTANPDGYIDWYNKRWYEYTGQTFEEARGWGWQTVHHPQDLPFVMDQWPRSLESGEPFELEFRLRGGDGIFRWFLTRVYPVRGENGAIIKWYGSNTDIDGHKQALQRKEEIVSTLQQVFIPKAFPTTKYASFDAVYIPAENDAQIGGDWYDAFELPDGRLAFSIGDVAGHGIEAAVTMGRIRQNIFGAALEVSDPAQILSKVNRVMLLQDATMATAIVGLFDPQTNEVIYACAGHAPPVLASRHGVQLLGCGGLALGIQENMELRVERFVAEPDMLLVLYTDGITEAGRDIVDGELRMVAAVEQLRESGNYEMAAQAIRHGTLSGRVQTDDVAILAIRFLDPASAGGVSSIQSRPLGMAWDFNSSDSHAAQSARRQTVEFVRRLSGGYADLFAVESIVGELIANTVDHAPGPVHIDIDWSDALPTLRVHDRGRPFEFDDSRVPDLLSEEGRGLWIIRALGSRVEIEKHTSGGKNISVVLPVRRASNEPL